MRPDVSGNVLELQLRCQTPGSVACFCCCALHKRRPLLSGHKLLLDITDVNKYMRAADTAYTAACHSAALAARC